jgi:hypothetical protein
VTAKSKKTGKKTGTNDDFTKRIFKPGESGNPSGRPQGAIGLKTRVQQEFVNLLATMVKGKDNKMHTAFEVFNQTLLDSINDPSSVGFRFMLERVYGPQIVDDIDNQIARQMRRDKLFAKYAIHNNAFDIQQRVLLSKSKSIGLRCGRRAGKTHTNQLKALDTNIEVMGAQILIVGLTLGTTMSQYWQPIIDLCASLDISTDPHLTDAQIKLPETGAVISFRGNSTRDEREKMRGGKYHLIIVDECQSQKDLKNLVESILDPMLADYNGTLMLTGSGPRTRGTYWEWFYNRDKSPDNRDNTLLRLNWNLSYNPHIHNYKDLLAEKLEKNGWTENDSTYKREWLGEDAYDDEALVFRLGLDNYYTEADMRKWVNSQPPSDIRFTAGLDYGYRDSDAFVIIMYSAVKREKFLIYEYKQNLTDVTTLYNAIKAGLDFVKNHELFLMVPNKEFAIYADTSDQKIALEFSTRFGLNVQPAYKHNKALAIQILQKEVATRNFKADQTGPFALESLYTVYKRVSIDGREDVLTREIDDELYHPDLMDAIIYSLRYLWISAQDEDTIEKQPLIEQPPVNPVVYLDVLKAREEEEATKRFEMPKRPQM